MVLSMTMDLSNLAILGDSDVRCQNDQDVAVFGDVVAESTPAGGAREGNACEASEMEDFTPPVSHNLGHIFAEVVVVEFVRARALCHHGVFGSQTLRFQGIEDAVFDVSGWHGAREILGECILLSLGRVAAFFEESARNAFVDQIVLILSFLALFLRNFLICELSCRLSEYLL